MEFSSNYCQACLSNDRRLHSLMQLQPIVNELNLWELNCVNGGLCWECRGIVMRFMRFRAQVLRTQELLRQCSRLEDLMCVSKLSHNTNCYYNYEFSYQLDAITDPKDVKIKDELDTNDIYEENYNNDEEKQYFTEIEKKAHDIDEIFKDYEEKPLTVDDNEMLVEILNSETKLNLIAPKRYKQNKPPKIGDTDIEEEELRQKFATVEFTEEEMLKNREEKRNQPNFKKIPYKCDSCVLGFTREDTYNIHVKKKHDENIGDHLCPVCQIRFPSKKLVERHKRKHYMCYRCRLCKYETLELWSALSHCRLKHGGDSRDSIHCPYCSTVAKTPEELSQHVGSEHSVICNECGEKFKGLSTLKSHKRRIHGVKREFICDICSKTFKTKSRLESHMASHNATLAQCLAYCAVCRVQYKNIYVYRNHLRTSANHADQAYQCRDCNKKFASKVYWKKHYNFYHLHKSQFHCDMCNKLFISEWRLKSHRQTQHGLSRTRDHHCTVCGKQFFTLSTLKGHQLTHSEQRTFMCEDCGDTFKQRPALYTHCKLVHQGVKRRKKV